MPIVSRYEVDRGRATELDKTGTGTASIEMIDTNGSLDPASGSTDYDPLTPAAIALENPVTGVSSPIFTGFVSRWRYKRYPTEQYALAMIECVDGMDIVAAAEMTPGAYGDGVDNGSIRFDRDTQVNHRINHVFDDLGWGANREFFTGNVALQETVYAARTQALSPVFDAADAEFPGVANFFFQRTGVPTFHGRLARFNPTDPQYHITTWKAGNLAAFAADSSTAVISDLEYDRDKERIINSALATHEHIHPDSIEAQRVEDAASIAQYGHRSWSAENLIIEHSWLTGNTALEECRDVYATYYVTNWSDPQTRVTRVQFRTVAPAAEYAAPTWALICGVDISDRIELAGFGFYFVEGLHYVVRPAQDDYLDVTLDLDLSPAANWTTLPS